jgi:hypothetical protein
MWVRVRARVRLDLGLWLGSGLPAAGIAVRSPTQRGCPQKSGTAQRGTCCTPVALYVGPKLYILAAQHFRQLVFTHRLGQRQASVVLAARVVEVRNGEELVADATGSPPPTRRSRPFKLGQREAGRGRGVGQERGRGERVCM